MKPMTAARVAEAVGGRVVGSQSAVVDKVFTDSRSPMAGGLFVPIRGERFDGHDYIAAACAGGAAAALTGREVEAGLPLIIVDDTKAALTRLAAWYRRQMAARVICVTGSVGKTTTKDMLACALARRYNVVKTRGNLNNDIGLPLSVLQIEEDTEVAVLELGMSGFGEIRALAAAAAPDAAVITNIGTAHIEKLGSREGIFRAKTEIFESLAPGGAKVLNGDDDLLRTIDGAVFYGIDHGEYTVSELIDDGLSGIRLTCRTARGLYELRVPAPGRHMAYAALCAVAVGELFGLSAGEIAAGVEAYEPSSGRGNVIQTARITIIDGTYNAGPDSMKAGIDALPRGGRLVAVLGEMLELGAEAARLHREVGEYAARAGLELVVCVGRRELAEGAGAAAVYYETKDALMADLAGLIQDGDAVLVKASHGVALGAVVDRLKEVFE